MNVVTVVVDLRRRMKPNGIKIACIYGNIVGRAQSYSTAATYMHSVEARSRPVTTPPAATVAPTSVNLTREMMGICRWKEPGLHG